MRRLFLLATLVFTVSAFALDRSPRLLNYGEGILNTASSSGTYMGALGSFWNPAGWATMSRSEAVFTWNDRNTAEKRLDNWGVHLGGHGFGASMKRSLTSTGEQTLTIDDYQLALAGGSRADNWGLSYGWSKGAGSDELRQHYLTLGNIMRPNKYFSIGCAGTLGLRNGRTQAHADLGIRPLGGSHCLTLFGDVAAHDKDNPKTLQWGAGVEVMPLDGFRVAGKISKLRPDDPAPWFTLGLGFSIDATSIHISPNYNKDSERQHTNYAVRVGYVEPSFQASKRIGKGERVIALGMRGRMTYQKSRWLERDRHALLEMLQLIEDAKQDKSVGGIALNLSGFSGPRELIWELSEKLKEFREAGKTVYMYVDRSDMTGMYLMTQADYAWMDPLGMVDMFGWVMRGTYYKGMLEKLGVGVEEWRYFEYKSAFEQLVRKDMSEKDREQRLALLTEFHAEWTRAMVEERGISADSVNLAIDSLGILTAHEAERFGFVDTLGRWDDAPDLIELFSGDKPKIIDREEMAEEFQSDPRWGEYPQIAVVYAVGECDMDTGIRARYTSRLLKNLAKDDDVEAVVLRVDSPGGDGLASDWVAEGMREVSNYKPMIVSQGRVAASGGYWLSSPGDRVFTSPFTITGSIGVIAGWLWNDGLTDKTGLTYDRVQVGRHADIGSGIVLPLINVEVPNRPISDDERVRVEKVIRGHYDDFVGRVAEDRDMSREDVEAVAQGRVWGGQAALDRNLVDEIGGIEPSILYAKDKAGIRKREKIRIVEYPKPGWIPFDRLFSSASPLSMLRERLGLHSSKPEDGQLLPYEVEVFKHYAEKPGQPLFMLPPEEMLDDN